MAPFFCHSAAIRLLELTQCVTIHPALQGLQTDREAKTGATFPGLQSLSLFAPPSCEYPPQPLALQRRPEHFLWHNKAQELDTARISSSGADSRETVPSLATSPLL